jgi:hypothetical protein
MAIENNAKHAVATGNKSREVTSVRITSLNDLKAFLEIGLIRLTVTVQITAKCCFFWAHRSMIYHFISLL